MYILITLYYVSSVFSSIAKRLCSSVLLSWGLLWYSMFQSKALLQKVLWQQGPCEMQQLTADWQSEVFANLCGIHLLCEPLQYIKTDGGASTESNVLDQHRFFSYTGRYSHIYCKICIGYVSIEENDWKWCNCYFQWSHVSHWLNLIILILFDLPALHCFPAKASGKFCKKGENYVCENIHA